MFTIILPGYSIQNRKWAYEVKSEINLPGEIIVYEWEHWSVGGDMVLSTEISKIIDLAKIKTSDQKVDFIAKSIGTKILMDVVPEIREKVNKIILCGISSDPKDFKKSLDLLDDHKILIFQNSGDPFINYTQVEKDIHGINKNIRIIEKPVDTHHYPYYQEFTEFLNS